METQVNTQDLLAQLAKLQSENERLKRQASSKLRLKVSEKGAVSLMGINARFPVTLYAQQWERVLDYGPEIKAFILENTGILATKGDQ